MKRSHFPTLSAFRHSFAVTNLRGRQFVLRSRARVARKWPLCAGLGLTLGCPGVLPARAPTLSALSAGTGPDGAQDVRGVSVETVPCPVVAHRDTRLSVRGGVLHLAEGHTGVKA